MHWRPDSIDTRASSLEYNTFSVTVDGEIGGVGVGGGKTDQDTKTETGVGAGANAEHQNHAITSHPTESNPTSMANSSPNEETTTELSVSPPSPAKTFGDHILEKWKGVYVN